MRARIRLDIVLALIGVALLGYVGETLLESEVREVVGNHRLERAWAKATQKTSDPGAVARRPEMGDLIGRLEIPRLEISALVAEGAAEGTLRTGIGHLPHTPLPGEPGNAGLAAHRDTHFRALRDVRIGDRIQLRSWSGETEFEVTATHIVMPKDVSVLDPTPEPTLTLITCYPFGYIGNAPKRFVVQAKRVLPQTANAPAQQAPVS